MTTTERTPLSILFTIPNFVTAGSGREMLQIIQRLDRRRFTPTICVLRREGTVEAEAERQGITVIEAPFAVPLKPWLSLPQRIGQAAQRFRPYRFDVWHSFNWSSDFTEPLIARLAGTRAWIYTKKNMGWNRRAWRLRTLLASAVMARNRDMMDRLFARAPYRKARLIWGGVDLSRFSTPLTPQPGLPVPSGDWAGAVVIVCVAQLVRVKGHPTLIRAVARNEGTVLALAGAPVDAAYAQELQNLVARLGMATRVRFLGSIADVRPLLERADIFVLPTSAVGGHEEGCPVALLEAMAMGKACVATDVAGSRDIVQHEQSGMLVAPDDEMAMSEVLRTLVLSPDLRSQLCREARLRVETAFTLERESREVADLYEALLM